MARAYSNDLRERVAQDAAAGLPAKDLAARYHVSLSWVNALKQRLRETGSIAALKQTKFRERVLADKAALLGAVVAARPDATLAELREALDTTAGLSTIWRELDRLQLTVKKNAARRRTTAS